MSAKSTIRMAGKMRMRVPTVMSMPLPEFAPKTIKLETTMVATPSRTSMVTEAGTQSAAPGHASAALVAPRPPITIMTRDRNRRTPLRTRPTILDTPS